MANTPDYSWPSMDNRKVIGKPFKRLDGQHAACVDAFAVEDDGAGATGAAIADLLGPRVIEVIPQGVEQGDAGLDGKADGFAVDV